MHMAATKSVVWVNRLKSVVAEINNLPPVPGYDKPRRLVRGRADFSRLVSRRLGTPAGYETIAFNSSSMDIRSFAPRDRDKLFAFKLGDRVRVSAAALGDLSYRTRRAALFKKPSEHGAFSAKVYVVDGARLCPTRKDNSLVDGSWRRRPPPPPRPC